MATCETGNFNKNGLPSDANKDGLWSGELWWRFYPEDSVKNVRKNDRLTSSDDYYLWRPKQSFVEPDNVDRGRRTSLLSVFFSNFRTQNYRIMDVRRPLSTFCGFHERFFWSSGDDNRLILFTDIFSIISH